MYKGYKSINCSCCDLLDKDTAVNNYIRWMLSRTQSMFRYSGLPSTIPQRELELILQIDGCVAVGKADKDGISSIYAFSGGLGGPPDEYYRPTLFILANPVLGSKEYVINRDCVIIKSDSLYTGLYPMFLRYATFLAENDVSIYDAQINSRIQSLISAPDDRTKRSAEIYMDKVKAGYAGIISENSFLDGIRTSPYAASNMSGIITSLIELQQYLKASWYNEIGLNANYNMKRESIMSAEAQLNTDALLPLVDDMLECRKEGIKLVNEMFGTNIEVTLNSSWEDIHIEENLTHNDGVGSAISQAYNVTDEEDDRQEVETESTLELESEETSDNAIFSLLKGKVYSGEEGEYIA